MEEKAGSKTMLTQIEIKGFKSIREAKLDIRDLNLLIGANGAGKSNLVAVFGLLSELAQGRLQFAVAKSRGAAALLHRGPKQTPRMQFGFTLGSSQYQAILEYLSDDSFTFVQESIATAGHVDKSIFAGGQRESTFNQAASDHEAWEQIVATIRSWRVYHIHDTSTEATVKRKGPIDDNESLRTDASNLAAFLYRLKMRENDAYRRIVAAIQQVAPFFADFRLSPDRLHPDQIQLEWTERDSDAYFNAHAFSDGTLRFICLATLLQQPELPSLILIDEPELGLHPYAITQLAALLKSASTRAQVLVATQSVTLMNQFEPDDVIVVDRKDGSSTFRHIGAKEIDAWKDSYALGELWEKNVLGGRPQR